MTKMAPKTWDKDKLECFDVSQRAEIQNLAVALSDEEVLQYYGLESFDDLPEYDRLFMKVELARGRLVAKQNACHSLFQAMSGKDALPASLAYLTRFGHSQWGEDKGTGASAPKSLRIIVEE